MINWFGGAASLLGMTLLLCVGDTYGINAHRYAKVKAELAATNADLAKLKIEDAKIEAKEAEDAQAADTDFETASRTLKKCVLNKLQADALNRIGG